MYILKRKLIYSIAYFFKQTTVSITGAVIYLGGVRDLHNLCSKESLPLGSTSVLRVKIIHQKEWLLNMARLKMTLRIRQAGVAGHSRNNRQGGLGNAAAAPPSSPSSPSSPAAPGSAPRGRAGPAAPFRPGH